MTSTKRILFVVFILIFFSGIAIGMIGRSICTRDNENYQTVQVELFAPDEIATVLHDADLHQIYVCYDCASYVNVYSEDGTFQWAVATPYLKSAYFELSDDRIIVYNWKDAYIYDSADGDFVEKNTVIGTVGTTGLSTGNHLHFGITVGGIFTDPMAMIGTEPDLDFGEAKAE